MDRIEKLILLKGKCLRRHDSLLERLRKKFGLNENIPCSNFFLAMSDVIDVFIINFINEEISASQINRHPLSEIISCAISNIYEKKLEYDDFDICKKFYLEPSVSDIQDLFSMRINNYLSSSFVDFSVSTYSVFEFWMSILYEEIKKKFLSEKKSRKEREIEKIIKEKTGFDDLKKINEASKDIVDKFLNFTSGNEKIEYILSKSSLEDLTYMREIITAYRLKRNTIHNLGESTAKDFDFSFGNGRKIKIHERKKVFSDDYSDSIILCALLVDCYQAIVDDFEINEMQSLIKLGA